MRRTIVSGMLICAARSRTDKCLSFRMIAATVLTFSSVIEIGSRLEVFSFSVEPYPLRKASCHIIVHLFKHSSWWVPCISQTVWKAVKLQQTQYQITQCCSTLTSIYVLTTQYLEGESEHHFFVTLLLGHQRTDFVTFFVRGRMKHTTRLHGCQLTFTHYSEIGGSVTVFLRHHTILNWCGYNISKYKKLVRSNLVVTVLWGDFESWVSWLSRYLVPVWVN